jgi:hypothetical protein
VKLGGLEGTWGRGDGGEDGERRWGGEDGKEDREGDGEVGRMAVIIFWRYLVGR